jgi:HEPN domain-containing protein
MSAPERWYSFAEEDLRMSELALEEGLHNQTCFHAQQCVEKALKALLVAVEPDSPPPRTHSVADLLKKLPARIATRLPPGLASSMDAFYLPSRYPDSLPGSLPDANPTAAQARDALRLARKALEACRKESGPGPRA